MFDDGTENFRPEGGVIYGSNACHEYRRRNHRLRGLGRHESRSTQNVLSRRGALPHHRNFLHPLMQGGDYNEC